ncbi:MAG: patatin-like phospholipase family protein [Chloroflexota bacterium]|nr:patatin-like phospholipase family protein [Chloroflexota bacterium]
MKPLKKNVAIAIDGGGIRGLVVTKALSVLETHLGKSVRDLFQLAVGTSTGSIIAAGIGMGISADKMTSLYLKLGQTIFPTTLRKLFFPLARYRYSDGPLKDGLLTHFGTTKMGDFWGNQPPIDVVITAYDLVENRTRFIKPWKPEYQNWLVTKAVQASCTVPTYFPIVDSRFIDGGVGSYGNPCYVAAYEAKECLGWDPAETTLISIGTGRAPYAFQPDQVPKLWAWDWIAKALGVFQQSAYDEQVHLVETYFNDLDFRRFQIDMRENIEMDGVHQMDRLVAYGARLGRMILNDQYDWAQGIVIKQAEY